MGKQKRRFHLVPLAIKPFCSCSSAERDFVLFFFQTFQMENIGNFLTFCDTLGVPKTDIFQTVDLYENQNIPGVSNHLSHL